MCDQIDVNGGEVLPSGKNGLAYISSTPDLIVRRLNLSAAGFLVNTNPLGSHPDSFIGLPLGDYLDYPFEMSGYQVLPVHPLLLALRSIVENRTTLKSREFIELQIGGTSPVPETSMPRGLWNIALSRDSEDTILLEAAPIRLSTPLERLSANNRGAVYYIFEAGKVKPVWLNREMREIAGITYDEFYKNPEILSVLIGQNINEDNIRESLANGHVIHDERRIVTLPNGNNIFLEHLVAPLSPGQSLITAVVWDISEAVVQERNRRIFTDILQKKTPVCTAMFDPDGKMVFVNVAGEKLSRELFSMVGQEGAGDIFKILNETDKTTVINAIKNSRDKNEEQIVNIVFKAGAGEERHFDFIFNPTEEGFVVLTAIEVTDKILVRQALERELKIHEKFTEDLIRLFGGVVELRDSITDEHVKNMGKIAYGMAKEMGFNEEISLIIKIAAVLHDIGKIGLPDRILTGGLLTQDERDMLPLHIQYAARILAQTDNVTIKLATPGIIHHHSRYDGSDRAYPIVRNPNNGTFAPLFGNLIPFIGRLLAVCDAYEAMKAERTYKSRKYPMTDAMYELINGAGSQFDPNLVVLFCEYMIPRDKEFYPNQDNSITPWHDMPEIQSMLDRLKEKLKEKHAQGQWLPDIDFIKKNGLEPYDWRCQPDNLLMKADIKEN